jgi:hypothetical protein
MQTEFSALQNMSGSRDSVVGIGFAAGWKVRGSNPVWARFSAPIQTGSGAHPASCTMGTASFLGVKAAAE